MEGDSGGLSWEGCDTERKGVNTNPLLHCWSWMPAVIMAVTAQVKAHGSVQRLDTPTMPLQHTCSLSPRPAPLLHTHPLPCTPAPLHPCSLPSPATLRCSSNPQGRLTGCWRHSQWPSQGLFRLHSHGCLVWRTRGPARQPRQDNSSCISGCCKHT
jgi:hypothetical protein